MSFLSLAFALVVAAVAVAGCGKDYPQCDKFVDLAFKCDEDLKSSKGDERDTTKALMTAMCQESFKNDTSGVKGETKQMVTEMYAEMRSRADCAAKANTCQQYEVCAPDR